MLISSPIRINPLPLLQSKQRTAQPSQPLKTDTLSLRFGAQKNTEEAKNAFFQVLDAYEHTKDLNAVRQALKTHGTQYLNQYHKYRYSAIHYATRWGDLPLVKLLIENGADVHQGTERDGLTALHLAVWKGKMDIVKFLVEEKGVSVNVAPGTDCIEHGKTPLHMLEGHDPDDLAMARYLLNKGALVNPMDSLQCTPLSNAVGKGATSFILLLLEHGADPNLASSRYSLNELLMRLSQKEPDTAALKALLTYLPDINAVDKDGSTIWRYVLHSKKYVNEKVDLLLQHGLDIHKDAIKGMSPIQYAALLGNLSIVKKLESLGASLTSIDKWGNDLFATAASSGNVELADYLFKKGGFSIATRNNAGQTPLMTAIYQGKSQLLVNYLLDHQADVNARDNEGRTPLMYAAKHSWSGIMDTLIQRGAKLNEKDNNGQTALMIAAQECSSKVMEKLLQHNANIHETDNNGKTALELIRQTKGHLFPWHHEMIALLNAHTPAK